MSHVCEKCGRRKARHRRKADPSFRFGLTMYMRALAGWKPAPKFLRVRFALHFRSYGPILAGLREEFDESVQNRGHRRIGGLQNSRGVRFAEGPFGDGTDGNEDGGLRELMETIGA